MANQKSATAKRARSKRDDKKQVDRGTSQKSNGNEAATYEQELAHYLQERIKPGLNRGSIALLARSIAKEIAHWRPDEDADVAGEPSNEDDDDVRDEVDDDDVRGQEDDDVGGEADDDVSDEEDDDVRGEADFDDEEDDDVRGEADVDFDDEENEDVRGEADFDEDDDDVRGEADDDFDGDEDDDVRGEADDDFSDEEDGNEGSLEDEMRDLQADLGDDWILRVSIQGEDAWLTAEKDDGSQHVEAPASDVLAEVVELLNESGGRASASRDERH